MPLHKSFVSCGVGELFGLLYFSPDRKKNDLGSPWWDFMDVGQWLFGPVQSNLAAYNPPGAHTDYHVNDNKAFLVFSDLDGPIWGIGGGRGGHVLQDAILANGLGEVTKVGPSFNPRTHRDISVYVWKINQENFKSWYFNNLNKNQLKDGTS